MDLVVCFPSGMPESKYRRSVLTGATSRTSAREHRAKSTGPISERRDVLATTQTQCEINVAQPPTYEDKGKEKEEEK
jgi:hypothetical protein